MGWVTILSGLCSVTMLALGLDLIVPLGRAGDSLCGLAAVGPAIVFLGLVEGA